MTAQQDHCARTQDAAAYVLGRLHGHRFDDFARHLRRCEECAEEVELLASAADAVPLLAPRHIPPPEQLEQQPARVAPTRRPGKTHDAPEPQARAQAPAQAQLSVHRPPKPPARRLLKNPMPKPAGWALAALAILAVVTVALSHRAASARYIHIRAGWSGGGAALQLQGNQLELLVTGMPRPAGGDGYRVWVVEKVSKRLAPTSTWLHLNRAGQAGAKVQGDYHDWDGVAVYIEPLHGRQTTKSGAVVVADLRKQR